MKVDSTEELSKTQLTDAEGRKLKLALLVVDNRAKMDHHVLDTSEDSASA